MDAKGFWLSACIVQCSEAKQLMIQNLKILCFNMLEVLSGMAINSCSKSRL